MTESVYEEKPITSTQTSQISGKIAERKTIVYETRVDPTVIKVNGEKLKTQLFARLGFMRPRPEEVRLVSVNKHYVPYMVLTGRYLINYYRKCIYKVKVDRKVLEIVLLNHRFKPSQLADAYGQNCNVIQLEGEERLMTEVKASLILDRYGQEAESNSLPSAPSERNYKKILKEYGVEEITHDIDLKIIRSKIFKRPKDVSRVIKEILEVSERAIIYTPRYMVVYRNLRTSEERTLEFDGVTGERVHCAKSPMRLLLKLA